jgi:Tfp pilus assembly protein PilE
MKNQKGVTLVALSITLILFTVVLTTITFSSVSSVHLRRLNNMYEDILFLQGRVNVYYAANGTVPSLDTEQDSLNDFRDAMQEIRKLSEGVRFIKINPNDSYAQNNASSYENEFKNSYKLLDLNELKKPAYGGDFELNNEAAGDSYAINIRSLQVYYCKGVIASEDAGDRVYSIPFTKYQQVNCITN